MLPRITPHAKGCRPGHSPLKADVRVIAATHQDLEVRVRAGQFREDLFHRLNVIRLRLPPLRERREDIPLLVRHFLQKSAQDLKVETKQLSPQAMSAVSLMALPGNVRQLENLCHWLTVMAPSQVVRAEDLPEEVRQPQEGTGHAQPEDPLSPSAARAAHAEPAVRSEISVSAWQELLRQEVARALAANAPAPQDGRMHSWAKEFEAAVLGVALKHTRGRRIEAAQLLGIGRNTMTRKIAELNLEGGD